MFVLNYELEQIRVLNIRIAICEDSIKFILIFVTTMNTLDNI